MHENFGWPGYWADWYFPFHSIRTQLKSHCTRRKILTFEAIEKATWHLNYIIVRAGFTEQGIVVSVRDGIARIDGLPSASMEELLRFADGRRDYSVIVVAEATAPAERKYLAPFAGCALCEAWMAKGRDTLVIYDDLSAHAEAYRELSLLLRRPPGREAYPGDIFCDRRKSPRRSK